MIAFHFHFIPTLHRKRSIEVIMDTTQKIASVLMLPWLGHSHASSFLELAMKLSHKNFFIYFCSTPVILSSLKPKISEKYSNSIQFVELHLPSLPQLPRHFHTAKDLPPHLNITLRQALDMASPKFSIIVNNLNPDLVIYDLFQPWAPAIASLRNIPAVTFLTSAASAVSLFVHGIKKPGDKFPFPIIYNTINSAENSTPEDRKDLRHRTLDCLERSSDIILVKSFREIEAKPIDYLSVLMHKKIVPVGPLVEYLADDYFNYKSEIIEWLDKKQPFSTVFVSFGSEYFLSKQEIEEIAHGLELSEVDFIWAVRFRVGDQETKLEEALPEGFLERVGERGLVVKGWAPQLKILGHSSTGGFVSHCGWGSVMESIKNGVPIVAMPMGFDQPFNAGLVEEIGVGVEVKRNENGGFGREEVAKVIREVVLEKYGENVRRRARDMMEIMRKKGEEDIDGVAHELLKLKKVY